MGLLTVSSHKSSKEYLKGWLCSKGPWPQKESFSWRHELIQYSRSWHFEFITIMLRNTELNSHHTLHPFQSLHNLHLNESSWKRHEIPLYIFSHPLFTLIYKHLKLYANTIPFYIKDLTIHRFWYMWGILQPVPQGYWGMTQYSIIYCFKFVLKIAIADLYTF